MKISMYILKHWFEEYDPRAIILEGDMTLEGPRMLSPQSLADSRYVSVSIEQDLLEDSDEYRVLLTNRNDVIQLSTDNIEDVFNRAVEVFEHYRNLEYQLMLAVNLDNPEQRLVEMCQEQWGPTYIMDRRFHLLAISHTDRAGAFHEAWSSYERNRIVSLEKLNERADNPFYQNINNKVHNLEFESPITEPYTRGLMNTYCNAEGDIIGQCMIAFDRPVEKADLQLVDVFMSYLREIGRNERARIGNGLSEMVFDALVRKQPVSAEDLAKTHAQQKWSDTSSFCVLATSIDKRKGVSESARANLLVNLQQSMNSAVLGSVSIIHDDRLLTCVPIGSDLEREPYAFIRKRIMPLGRMAQGRIGMSYAFKSFSDAYCYVRQAMLALDYAIAHGKDGAFIADCALEACIVSTDLRFKLSCAHPLVRVLGEYDAEHDTEYGITLRDYLRHDRRIVETANFMNLHRNTVIYRIEKITKMYPDYDLDDPDEREYLLYSFRLRDTVARMDAT